MALNSRQKTLIVGAGPVGALAALYAAKRGDDVEVYELRGGMNSTQSFDEMVVRGYRNPEADLVSRYSRSSNTTTRLLKINQLSIIRAWHQLYEKGELSRTSRLHSCRYDPDAWTNDSRKQEWKSL